MAVTSEIFQALGNVHAAKELLNMLVRIGSVAGRLYLRILALTLNIRKSTLRDSLAIEELNIADRTFIRQCWVKCQLEYRRKKLRENSKLCCERLQRLSDRVPEFRNS